MPGSPGPGGLGDSAGGTELLQAEGACAVGRGSWVGTSRSGFVVGVFFVCIPVVCCFGEDAVPASVSAGFQGTVCVCRRAGLRVSATCQDSGAPSSCLTMEMLGFLDSEKLIF